jgi:hypothetical protein
MRSTVRNGAIRRPEIANGFPNRDPIAQYVITRGWLSEWLLFAIFILFSVSTAIYPSVRGFHSGYQVNYNEGWNVYNAERVAKSLPLYYPKYNWTVVNYPPLSFYVVAYLSHFTHSYLLSGRLLSLISLVTSCLVVGLIIAKLTGEPTSGLLGGLFCLALFCAESSDYVAMDDPQMLAQLIFLTGFWLYLSRPRTPLYISATVFLFALGGCIKHNLFDFPLAVFLDLCFVSHRKALQFVLFAATFVGISVVVNTYVGGPFFVSQILTPRAYSLVRVIRAVLVVYGPIQLPFMAALLWAIRMWTVKTERVISLFFFASLCVGVGLSGGAGSSSNYFFSNFVAISIICGVLFHRAMRSSLSTVFREWRWGIPIVLFSSLLYPWYLSGGMRLKQQLAGISEQHKRFEAEVAFLRAQEGPAICESLLRCYDAGKPYVYDPFNSTSLVKSGKLDSKEIVLMIAAHRFGAIQLKGPLESLSRPNDHFPNEILDAINVYYAPWLRDPDCYIYLPRNHSVGNVPKP